MTDILDRIEHAIWQAHKDNLHLKMTDVYPIMARAVVEILGDYDQSADETVISAPAGSKVVERN